MYKDISMRITDEGNLEVTDVLRAAPLPLLSVIVGETVIRDLCSEGSSPYFILREIKTAKASKVEMTRDGVSSRS